jgi:hypothetical protein
MGAVMARDFVMKMLPIWTSRVTEDWAHDVNRLAAPTDHDDREAAKPTVEEKILALRPRVMGMPD